jgi:hypothetical protein
MTHNEVINETTRHLSSHFLPDPDPMNIKKWIEALIEVRSVLKLAMRKMALCCVSEIGYEVTRLNYILSPTRPSFPDRDSHCVTTPSL